MGKSKNRDLYFARAEHCTDTPQAFVAMLEKSPYAIHREHAVGLRRQLNEMSAEVIAKLKKQEESNKFAAKIMS
jgi:hypothetical protein